MQFEIGSVGASAGLFVVLGRDSGASVYVEFGAACCERG